MRVKEITRIALMGAMMYAVFQAFSNILYLEMITFTILSFSQVFSRKEVILACLLFSCIQILLNGLMIWNVAYLIIFPTYGFLFSSHKKFLENHKGYLPFYGAFFSFLIGQLVDLPFLLFSKTVTMIYMLMGLKTSLIQGLLTFIVLLFLFEPVHKILEQIKRQSI